MGGDGRLSLRAPQDEKGGGGHGCPELLGKMRVRRGGGLGWMLHLDPHAWGPPWCCMAVGVWYCACGGGKGGVSGLSASHWQDLAFVAKWQRCLYLKEKLTHIKAQIHEYDRSSDRSVVRF